MAGEDQGRGFFNPEGDPAGGLEVEAKNGGLVSRLQALKLAGAATVGGAFGLFGSQEFAYARRQRTRRTGVRASVLGATLPGPGIAEPQPSLGTARLAQTFTNPVDGRLTHVQIAPWKDGIVGAGNYLIQINEVLVTGYPSNTVLASTTVLDSSLPEGTPPILVAFPTPAAVVRNQKYALVVSRPQAPLKRFHVLYNTGYAGELFTSPTQDGEFVPYNPIYADMIFATYVRIAA
jgi:hypothetical protein